MQLQQLEPDHRSLMPGVAKLAQHRKQRNVKRGGLKRCRPNLTVDGRRLRMPTRNGIALGEPLDSAL